MTYAPAFKPAFGVFGRTVRRQWPVLLGITAAYGLAQWGLKLAWPASAATPGGLALSLTALVALSKGGLALLLVALLTQLALTASDQRPLVAGQALGDCVSTLPVLAISLLLQYGPSLAITLWREVATGSGDIPRMGIAVLLASLASTLWSLITALFVGMAVPIRIDRKSAIWPTFKASAELGRRRWGIMMGVWLLTYLLGFVFAMLLSLRFMVITPEQGQFPDWVVSQALWEIPVRALGVLTLLYWTSLYVVLREQTDVAETFD